MEEHTKGLLVFGVGTFILLIAIIIIVIGIWG